MSSTMSDIILDKLKTIDIKLDYICEYIRKVDSSDYRLNEDLKTLVTNLVADLYSDRRFSK